MEDHNIKRVFNTAELHRSRVESALDSNTETFRENLVAAIATYEECRALADRTALFSPNEILEDISTGDLPYLLINFRLGDLISRISYKDRKEALQDARNAYERYLNLLSHYEILSATEKRLHQRYIDSSDTFSTVPTKDPGQRRAGKIANFQEEKELNRKLEFLSRDPAYLENDDDAVRQLHLANVRLCTHRTFKGLEDITRELEVLALAPPALSAGPQGISRDNRERNAIPRESYSDRLDTLENSSSSGPILSRDGKPLRPFTLLSGRQRIQDGVFRPDHNLPTMTIDEYLEEERARGGIIEGGGEASGLAPEPDEDNHSKSDAETMKARQWDEYVEANPKGSGNTLNRG
ncbi:MAG: hypothetical protein M1818_003820 [Claussenomyces sp. TS43310]|nr:MAG: hypothetical protein M1818_003820 [Claussenomyces sp. TS43310]